MTMTTATETFVEAARRNQEAFLHMWTDSVQKFWGLVPAADATAPSVPSAEEVVDNAFDFAQKVLATQRELTKTMLAATKSVASNTAWLAQNSTKGTSAKKG
jgi:hypothetical protein